MNRSVKVPFENVGHALCTGRTEAHQCFRHRDPREAVSSRQEDCHAVKTLEPFNCLKTLLFKTMESSVRRVKVDLRSRNGSGANRDWPAGRSLYESFALVNPD